VSATKNTAAKRCREQHIGLARSPLASVMASSPDTCFRPISHVKLRRAYDTPVHMHLCSRARHVAVLDDLISRTWPAATQIFVAFARLRRVERYSCVSDGRH
jgi:hypothetical protein